MSAPETVRADAGRLLFASETGMQYVYDDHSGVVLPAEALQRGCSDPFNKYDSARYGSVQEDTEVSPSDIRAGLVASTTLQITLLVTDRCNLRCRYCAYSGNYEYSRTHGSSDMPLDVAIGAVDYLRDLARIRERHNPSGTPALGFYGGEPLLQLGLIKSVVDYTEKVGFDCTFNITTNGTLLNDETIAFLVSKKFNVAVSLDGPPEEHDRNRVFPDGKGSFERVFTALCKLREENLRVHGSTRAPYIVLTCADRATDLQNVCSFFDSRPDLFRNIGGRVSMVYPYRTSYYTNWKDEDLVRAERGARKLWLRYLEALAAGIPRYQLGFPEWLFGTSLKSLLISLSMEPSRLRGACIPGPRIAVDRFGRFHICERVNQNYPIGDLDNGLNVDYICDIIRTFQRHLAERCRYCSVKRLCNLCYAHVLTEGGTKIEIPDGFCEDIRALAISNLSAMYTVLESNPDALQLSDVDRSTLEQDRIFRG